MIRVAPMPLYIRRSQPAAHMRNADEIEYRLIGDDLQAVIVTLNPGEAVTVEAIAMMYRGEFTDQVHHRSGTAR